MTLEDDIAIPKESNGGFDAIICMGNSFAHLPDFRGDQREHKIALENFRRLLKPGGILVIDHRNYDYILQTGKAPSTKNVYYSSDHVMDIKTSVLMVNNRPTLVTLDYAIGEEEDHVDG